MMGAFGLTLPNRGVLLGAVTPDELLDLGEAADRSGAFQSIWVGDSLLAKPRVESVVGHVAMLTAAGLDYRFRWSPMIGWPVQVLGLAGVATGLAASSWAMLTNAYFSSTVRVQRERGHHVITDGPYRFVRHPGYGGYVIFAGATPLLLGSLGAFVPATIVIAAIVARTWLEDRTLRVELDGYDDYSCRVRYRLIPRLW
jgi:protein-S-isoprenylcysteine O-methyltransferase Ste14